MGRWTGIYIRNLSHLPFWVTPVNCRGQIGRYGTVAFLQQLYGPISWYNSGGAVLGVGRWNGRYIRTFPLLAFGVPIAPTVLGVGGSTHPKFGMVVDLSSILDEFVFVFR